jgi:tetratricopeptide (TPR) repeat protein
MPRAREYALKALELDGGSSEAHVVLGLVKLLYDWDWPGAQGEFKYDSHLNPDGVGTFPCYLHSGDTLGRSNEALAELTSQLVRDPLSPINNLEVVCSAYYARQYDLAISHYWRTIKLVPGFPLAYANVGRAYVQKRRYSEAIAELEKGRKLDPGSPLMESELAYALAASGKIAAARKIVTQLETQAPDRYVDPYLIAPIYIPLGEPDEAFKWLENAYAERSSGMPWLKADPKFDSIRSDPRYQDLLRRVGFRS